MDLQRFEKLLKEAEQQLKEVKGRISKLDKAAATAQLQDLKRQLEELSKSDMAKKVKNELAQKLTSLQSDFKNTSSLVLNLVDNVKSQLKKITKN